MTTPQNASESEKLENPKVHDETKYSLEEIRLGIWKVTLAKNIALDFGTETKAALPLFWTLLRSIFAAAPGQLIIFVLCQLWHGVKDAIQMHISSSFLRNIELGLATRQIDATAIGWSLAARVIFSILVGYVSWCDAAIVPVLENRIKSHLDIEIMQTKLKMDIPTSQGATTERPVSSDEVWGAMKNVLNFITEGFRLASQLFLVFQISRSTGGPFFAILCGAKPLLTSVYPQYLWRRVFVAYIDNDPYKRMKSLEKLADGTYQQDIVSHGLRDWIISQYRKAYQTLGNLSVADPFDQFSQRKTPVLDIAVRLFGEFPFIYCAILTVLFPTRFSVASIAILQESTETLGCSLDSLFSGVGNLRTGLATIRRLDPSRYQNMLRDGTLPYPAVYTHEKSQNGMAFELKNVNFAYPGSEKTSNALENVSVNIKSGNLVVIVGTNGSGKSTLIRILSRLYDPSSGEVSIDGQPSSSYRVSDLHRATAILSQDSPIYPLSLAENIGLGCPSFFNDEGMIEEAARNGGASEFIGKFVKGYDTHLEPFSESFHMGISSDKKHPLWKRFETIGRNLDISGGEKQRVVASRTFMRFKSGLVKFVAVDEPSSALDADGELQLFKRLLAQREGKTMVFVTHRFAHLTKVADQIICMKDGSIVEMGKHEDLMSINGEYAKLYNIQANAFQESKSSAP